MGKTITVSTDDFDGMCEPPDTWPQDSSTTPPCGLEAGTQTGPRQKLSAGMGGVVNGVPPVQCRLWGQLESPLPRGSGLEPQLGPIPLSREPTFALPARSAHEPAGRAGGRGPWPVRAPTPRPGRSCCRTPSAPRSPSPGLTRPVCSGAATSTRSCSGLCPPGPRWVHLPRWVCQIPGRCTGPR